MYLLSSCIAASLIIFTGWPNAFSKSNPSHPLPRFAGSLSGFPCTTGAGIANRNHVVFPAAGVRLDGLNQFPRRHRWPRIDFKRLAAMGCVELHMRAAD